MSFLKDFRREVLQIFGLEGDESSRFVLDLVFGAIGISASCVIIVFVFEKQPSPELRHYALIALIALVVVILVSQYKAGIFMAIFGFIGFRLLIGALLYHYWPGFLFAGLCAIVVLLIAKFSPGLWVGGPNVKR